MRKSTNSKQATKPTTKSSAKSSTKRTDKGRLKSTATSYTHALDALPGEDAIDKFLLEYAVEDDEAALPESVTPSTSQDADETPTSTFTEEDFDRLLDDFIRSESTASDEEATDGAASDEEASSASDVLPPSEPLLKSMDFLVGLDSVKAKLAEYEKVVRFNSWRTSRQLPVMSMPLHAMFLGSPGTGKTTVAKMMGMMLRRAGLLSQGHVVVRERSMLMGNCYGDQEAKTLEAINEAEGGILLIDEAYQLYQPADPRDPGKLVIETLLTALADEARRNWMLILAGYPDEMRRMFEMNPGLSSRIPESNIYVFDDLDEGQLMQVAERYFDANEYTLSPEAYTALSRRIAVDYARRSRSFGNARYVRNLIQSDIIPAMATRVVNCGISDVRTLTTILPADIPEPVPMIACPRRPIGFVA